MFLVCLSVRVVWHFLVLESLLLELRGIYTFSPESLNLVFELCVVCYIRELCPSVCAFCLELHFVHTQRKIHQKMKDWHKGMIPFILSHPSIHPSSASSYYLLHSLEKRKEKDSVSTGQISCKEKKALSKEL